MQFEKDKYLPVIITVDHYNALGVIRNLGEEGLKSIVIIYGVGFQKPYIAYSKYVKQFKIIHESNNNLEKEILDSISDIKISDKNHTPVLFPIDDEIALMLDRNRNDRRLSGCIVPNACGNMEVLLDKNCLKELAKKHGICVPEGKVIELSNYDHAEYWDIYPCIVKPLQSLDGKKSDISIAYNTEQLDEIIKEYKQKKYNRLLVEKYIDSAASNMVEILGYAYEGQIEFSSQIEKIREYPIKNGSTAYAKLIEPDSDVIYEQLRELFQEVKFTGLFDVELKRDGKNLYFIEINFRNGAPGYCSKYIGKNNPYDYIRLLAGEKIIKTKETDSIRKPIYFMCEQYDVINMMKGYVNPVRWIYQFIHAKKIFFKFNDFMPPIISYIRLLIHD